MKNSKSLFQFCLLTLLAATLISQIGCGNGPGTQGSDDNIRTTDNSGKNPSDNSTDNSTQDGAGSCANGEACLNGGLCHPVTKKCTAPECEDSSTCQTGESCVGRLCVADSQRCLFVKCGDGFVCEDGACKPDCDNPCNGVCCGESETCFEGATCVPKCGDSSQTLCSYDQSSSSSICCTSTQSCAAYTCAASGESCNLQDENYCLYTSFCNQEKADEDGVCVRYEDVPSLCLSPKPDAFNVTEVLRWAGSPNVAEDEKLYNQVMSTPMVADLMGDGSSAIIFTGFKSGGRGGKSGYNLESILYVIDGKAGPGGKEDVVEHWNSRNLGADSFYTYGATEVTLADLDGKDGIDIIAPLFGGGLIAINGKTKEILWKEPSDKVFMRRHVAVVDLDHDGTPELVTPYGVYDGATGKELCAFPKTTSDTPIPVDFDLDGKLEIVGANYNYRFERADDGSVTCPYYISETAFSKVTALDGWPRIAVADIDKSTPQPELVVSANCQVAIFDYQGNVLKRVDYPDREGTCKTKNRKYSGVPTIADFDGAPDGNLEIAIAGPRYYSVYDKDLNVMWSYKTKDFSSGATGSSVFDFDGDGAAEAVYNDEDYLYVFYGKKQSTGSGTIVGEEQILFKTSNTNRTLVEYPAIVDVDHDGSADIVVSTNQFTGKKTHGVRVFSEANNRWVATRTIWNQHAYQPTFIREDGKVPQNAPEYWKKAWSNNFRQNPQTDSRLAPDLTPEFASITTIGACGESANRSINFRILNRGDREVPAGRFKTHVSISKAGENNWTVVSPPDYLNPGPVAVRGYIDMSVKTTLPDELLNEKLDIKIEVDVENKVVECIDTNNTTVAQGVPNANQNLLIKIGSIQDARCSADSGLKVKLEIKNEGTATIPAGQGVKVNLYVGSGGQFEAAHTITIDEEIGATAISKEVLLPVPSSLYGKPLEVYAVIDEDNEVVECNEADNRIDYSLPLFCINLG